jgi:hypothetical protein
VFAKKCNSVQNFSVESLGRKRKANRKSSASHLGGPGSSPFQVIVGFLVDRAALGRFFPSTLVSNNNDSTDFSTVIIIHHPGLVKQAKQWPMYQVDSVLPHRNKLKKKVSRKIETEGVV